MPVDRPRKWDTLLQEKSTFKMPSWMLPLVEVVKFLALGSWLLKLAPNPTLSLVKHETWQLKKFVGRRKKKKKKNWSAQDAYCNRGP